MYLTNILHIAPNKVSNIIGLKFKDLTVKSMVATALSLFVVSVTYKLLCPFPILTTVWSMADFSTLRTFPFCQKSLSDI